MTTSRSADAAAAISEKNISRKVRQSSFIRPDNLRHLTMRRHQSNFMHNNFLGFLIFIRLPHTFRLFTARKEVGGGPRRELKTKLIRNFATERSFNRKDPMPYDDNGRRQQFNAILLSPVSGGLLRQFRN